MSQDQTIDHGDHEHSVEEVVGLFAQRVAEQQQRLQLLSISEAILRKGLFELLKDGGSVRVDISQFDRMEMLNDDGAPITEVEIFVDGVHLDIVSVR
jgi:hypothetical protein